MIRRTQENRHNSRSPGKDPRGLLRSRRLTNGSTALASRREGEKSQVVAGAKRGRDGLTLLEVLLAMAILLLSLTAISHLVDVGAESALRTQFQASGTRLAHSKLAEVEAGVISLMSESSGTFEDQYEPEWNWSVTPVPEGTANLYLVTIKVWRDFKGQPFEIEFTQYMVDPTKLGTASQAEKPTQSPDTDSTTSGSGGSGGTGGTGGTTGGASP